jgi:PKD repeat protein
VTLTILSENDAPVVNAGKNVTADEGETISFSGTVFDPGYLLGEAIIHWDFGDGALTTGSLTPTHTFADNGIYTVTLTYTDTEGAVSSYWLLATINNASPVLDMIVDQTVSVGEVVNFSAPYMDPGILDTHSGTIDWGNAITESATLSSATVSGSHNYTVAGVYTVTVTLTDDDGGVAVQTFTVTVTAVHTSYAIYLPVIQRP